MSTSKKISNTGIVYSTDPSFNTGQQDDNDQETPAPAAQKLRVRLETKHRAGKAVTLIEGFAGQLSDMEELGKKLKNHCGAGGSVKDGEIIVQGDHREKVWQWLQKNGFTQSRKG